MSATAWSVVAACLGFQFTALIYLAYSLSRVRERLARAEQHLDDVNHRTQDERNERLHRR